MHEAAKHKDYALLELLLDRWFMHEAAKQKEDWLLELLWDMESGVALASLSYLLVFLLWDRWFMREAAKPPCIRCCAFGARCKFP